MIVNPLSNHQIGILLLLFDNTTFIYHLRATSTKLHSLDTPTSATKSIGLWAHYVNFCFFACFFHTFQNDHFRAFFTIFLQLATVNSTNRCSPASFPYINANPSSRDYICQVIASGCTYKLQKRFVCVCVVLIYGKIGPLKVSDFDLFLAFFDSQPLSNRQIGILLPHFGNTTFIYHLHATTTTLHSLDTPRTDKKHRYVGALRRFSIFCLFFSYFSK